MTEEKNKNKEEIILQAARKRFAYYGFSKVTMDEIAQDAGMGKASLYYYFPTKEDLFKMVISHEQDEFIKKLEEILENKSTTVQKLNQYVPERMSHFEVFINLGKLSFQSFQELKPLFSDLHKKFSEREHALLSEIIEEGIKNGELRKGDSNQIATLILHILHGLRLRTFHFLQDMQANKELYENLKNEMHQVINMIIDGIRVQ